MPKGYPPELKRDVVHVARTSGLTHAQIAVLGSYRRSESHIYVNGGSKGWRLQVTLAVAVKSIAA